LCVLTNPQDRYMGLLTTDEVCIEAALATHAVGAMPELKNWGYQDLLIEPLYIQSGPDAEIPITYSCLVGPTWCTSA
jgi:hypothetical protein